MTMACCILTKPRNYIIIYVIAVLVRLTVCQIFTQFIMRNDLVDMRCSYPGTSTATESVINCARLCSQDSACAAFTGSDADLRCLLHTGITSGSCSAASGYVTYVQGVSSGSQSTTVTPQTSTTTTTQTTSPTGQMFRLYDKTEGSGFAYGYIEVLESGVWFELCDIQYVNVDHAALCARMGYGGKAVPLYGVYGAASSTDLLQSLACNSDYTMCSNTVLFPIAPCERSGLYCSSIDVFQGIRLLDGATSDDGRVEIRLGDTWGTICGKDVGTDAARLLCLSLGYNDQQAFGIGAYTPGTGPIWWTGLDCDPADSALDTCTVPPDASCDHNSDFNLHCRY